ncbi:MAG: tyrosine-type recombinase/integrase [Candidatus Marsarchaeota archaeon]|nr:tyrosine-type recombinase/integrase [Candidatus Marsarchaeota archaeon]
MTAAAPIRIIASGSMDTAIPDFETRLRAQGRSEHTVSCYMRDLRCFARALGGTDLATITPAMIDIALIDPVIRNTPNGSPKSPATMHRMKAVVRSFFSWTLDARLCESNPARCVTTKRLSRTPPAYLTEAEKKRLLKELNDRSNPLAQRDRVVFELFLGTGIRLSELVNLDLDDVDLDGKHIRIMGKGGVPQVKFLKSSLRTMLRAYLKERTKLMTSGCTALFVSSRGTRLCNRQVALRLSYWLDKAGIQKNITPHGLRHTFASHLYASTSDLLMVKRALGHRDISTTEIYTHLTDEALEDALERM